MFCFTLWLSKVQKGHSPPSWKTVSQWNPRPNPPAVRQSPPPRGHKGSLQSVATLQIQVNLGRLKGTRLGTPSEFP